MTANTLNPDTPNIEMGIVFSRSGKVPAAFDTHLGELATGMKAAVAGTVVYKNDFTDEVGAWNFEAGEYYPIAFSRILAGPVTIRGIAYSTTLATDQIWWSAASQVLGSSYNTL